jgi:hypothetical protein
VKARTGDEIMREPSAKIRRASHLLKQLLALLREIPIATPDPLSPWRALGLEAHKGTSESQRAIGRNFQSHRDLSPGAWGKKLFHALRTAHVTAPEGSEEHVAGLCNAERTPFGFHLRGRRGQKAAEAKYDAT